MLWISDAYCGLEWSYTDVQAYLDKMREGLGDPTIHAYHFM